MLKRLLMAGMALYAAHRAIAGEDPLPRQVHRLWSTRNGLPQSSVNAIAQTPDGYLWIATFGGLARFNGLSFTVFDPSNTPQLKSMRLRALFTDSRGSLWIGTEHGGLTKWDHGEFRTFSEADGLPSSVVVSLASDNDGALVAGTTNGAARLVEKRFLPIETTPAFPSDTVSSIWHDRDGSLWFGTESSGLVHVRGRFAETFTSIGGHEIGPVQALAGDEYGALWIGTKFGLTRFSKGTFSEAKTKAGSGIGAVMSLQTGSDGVIRVGTAAGIYRVTGETLELSDRLPNVAEAAPRTLFVDREHSLWAGSDEGLHQWRKTNTALFGKSSGLTDRPVASIYRDHAGALWIGSLGDGLFRYRDDQFTRFRSNHQIESPASITEDRKGDLWLGDWSRGLLRIHGQSLESINLPGLDGKAIRSAFHDSRGTLWIGTDQRGLYKLAQGHAIAHYRQHDGLLSDTVVYIFEDRSGSVWLVCPEGLSRVDGNRFVNFRNANLRLARALQQAPDGALWVGTYGYGLFRLRNGTLRRITTRDGLPESVVSVMIPGEAGYVWMSGNLGLHRCRWQDLNDFADGKRADVECASFGSVDGLDVSEANGIGQPAGAKAINGQIWFAMVRGAAAVAPFKAPPTNAPVAIEQVLIDGKPVPAGSGMKLRPNDHTLLIMYDALTFLRPEAVRFKYRLEGLDRNWTEAALRRSVVYQGLSPGEYTFRVISDNGFGVWSKTGATLHFRVLAPFWRTGWAISLATLMLAAAAFAWHQLRLNRLKKAHAMQQTFSRLLIEAQERERQTLAAELHDGLAQNLLVIKNRAFLAAKSLPDRAAADEQVSAISSAAADAMEEMRTITFNLHPYRLDRFGLSKSIVGICVEVGKSANIAFKTDVDTIDGLFTREAEKSIFRVIQEGVNNIIKHSGARSASVAVKHFEDDVTIEIADDGCGFLSSEAPESGFGLIGMAERIRILGGTYSVNSSGGKGTQILIRLRVQDGR